MQYFCFGQVWQVFFQCGQFCFGVFIVVFGFFLYVMDSVFVGIEVSQSQFGIDNINIFCWVYFICYMDDIVVFKVVNYVIDSFSFMDIGQELVI